MATLFNDLHTFPIDVLLSSVYQCNMHSFEEAKISRLQYIFRDACTKVLKFFNFQKEFSRG